MVPAAVYFFLSVKWNDPKMFVSIVDRKIRRKNLDRQNIIDKHI